ncbi:MAG TPA: ATP-binding cassette domain-containing protein [Flexilinea sp.]|nr:ATP-binding cassette domain-containing protein [Flexilinea sp.]
MLSLSGIHKYYNPGTINEMCMFSNFSLTIQAGEFISIIGSNGSGKTSLLNIICGSIPVDEGKIVLDGVDITQMPEYLRHRKIGRVFQNPALGSCPNLTILENLSLADNKGKSYNLRSGTNKNRISYYRDQLHQLKIGLEDKLNTKVGNLSGGQRQALSILMATMTPIEFLILDEHTAALDPATAETIMALTDQIIKEKKITAIMVTHNLRYAVEYGNRLLMMHQGNIIIDKSGAEKAALTVESLVGKFSEISIELGN